MDGPDHLSSYLEAGAGLRAASTGELRQYLLLSLHRHAQRRGLRPPWLPDADDPAVIVRLRDHVRAPAAAATGTTQLLPRTALLRFLDGEVDRAFLRLLSAIERDPRDREALDCLFALSEPVLARVARLVASKAPWMLGGSPPQPIPEAIRDRTQSFWLRLIESDALAIRGFEGGTLDKWGPYLATLFRRHLVTELRRETSARRGGGSGIGAIGPGRDLDTSQPGACRFALRADQPARVECGEVLDAIDEYSRRGEGPGRDADLIARVALGDTLREVESDPALALRGGDARNALRRVRRFLHRRGWDGGTARRGGTGDA